VPLSDPVPVLAGHSIQYFAAWFRRLRWRRPAWRRARGGIFPQKISNSERVLLTILYQKGLCTLDVLADALGDVSRSAIGNVIRETRPLLQQEGHIPCHAPNRYRTAADLLAAAPASRGTPTG
jgi:hypothetical protein